MFLHTPHYFQPICRQVRMLDSSRAPNIFLDDLQYNRITDYLQQRKKNKNNVSNFTLTCTCMRTRCISRYSTFIWLRIQNDGENNEYQFCKHLQIDYWYKMICLRSHLLFIYDTTSRLSFTWVTLSGAGLTCLLLIPSMEQTFFITFRS